MDSPFWGIFSSKVTIPGGERRPHERLSSAAEPAGQEWDAPPGRVVGITETGGRLGVKWVVGID
jgi:hypothetical protein